MAKSKTSSKGKQSQYTRYKAENHTLTNKQRRVKKHLKQNPNAQIDTRALTGHTRKTPISSHLTRATKRIKGLMKYFTKGGLTKDQALKNLTQLKRETGKLRATWAKLESNATIKGTRWTV